MAKILIPSRNRPESLGKILGYLARFYPQTEVIIANGSSTEYIAKYNQMIKAFDGKLSIEHRTYDVDFPFFDRILDVLENIDDEFVIMGADDDYPIIDIMEKGEAFLNKNPDYYTAMGSIIHLTYKPDGKISARLGHARSIMNASPQQRVKMFAQWPFSTTYAVTRREHLIERYKRARTMFLANFFDFVVGIHDCLMGKFKAYGDIGYICTRHARHSYLRADDQLVYLRRSKEVLKLVDLFRDDLMKYADCSKEIAQREAIWLIRRRIEHLAGVQPHGREGFASTKMFQEAVIQQQYDEFHGLFTSGHTIRESMIDRVQFIVDALKDQAVNSTDNQGEATSYETLNEQMSGTPDLKV